MLRNRWAGDRKMRRNGARGQLSVSDETQYLAAARFGDCTKGGVHEKQCKTSLT